MSTSTPNWPAPAAPPAKKRWRLLPNILGGALLFFGGCTIGSLAAAGDDSAASPTATETVTETATETVTETVTEAVDEEEVASAAEESPSTAPASEATPAPAPSSTTREVDLLLAAAQITCEAGAVYWEALAAFIDTGPQGSVASTLDPFRVALRDFDAALSGVEARPGVAQMQEAVADYAQANEGLTVLFTEGETAYQPVKASGLDADVLRDSGEEKWNAGAAQLFANEAPSAPTVPERSC